MYLTPEQTTQLLTIIQNNQSILVAEQFGPEFLSEYDKSLLESSGVDWRNLYSEENDSIFQSFNLGMLAQSLHDNSKLKNFKFAALKKYVKSGSYIPIGDIERQVLNQIKTQSYADIKTNNGKIFQDITGVLQNHNTLKQQEELLRREILEGTKKKNVLREIANDISRKTGDWSRNFDRIVDYQCNSAYQAGRLASIERRDKSLLVYKKVFATGCKHCVKLYLSHGVGSEPVNFTIEQLRANGTNIGRKTDEWKPTVDSTHPHCRCLIFERPKNSKWNSEKQRYEIDTTIPVLKNPRKPIRAKIQGEEFLV